VTVRNEKSSGDVKIIDELKCCVDESYGKEGRSDEEECSGEN